MKVTILCTECFHENAVSNFEYKNIDINDEGIFELECSHGHKTATLLQNEKFEVLFDMGELALQNGYKQEAVACFAASLERFHEWCVLVFLIRNNIDLKEYEKTWKLVKKQSERQLGSFYFLYLKEFKESPNEFKYKMETYKNGKEKYDTINFRNNVIHNGYIPRYEQVLEYEKYLFEHIRKILIEIKKNYQECINKVSLYRQERIETLNPDNIKYATIGINTVLGLYTGESEYEDKTFEDVVNNFRKSYNLFK